MRVCFAFLVLLSVGCEFGPEHIPTLRQAAYAHIRQVQIYESIITDIEREHNLPRTKSYLSSPTYVSHSFSIRPKTSTRYVSQTQGDLGATVAGLATQLSQAGSQMATVPIGTHGLSPSPYTLPNQQVVAGLWASGWKAGYRKACPNRIPPIPPIPPIGENTYEDGFAAGYLRGLSECK